MSGCGTGGHYYPALAVVRCLLDAGAGARLLVDRAGGAAAARDLLGAGAPVLELPQEPASPLGRLRAAAGRYLATGRLLASDACQVFLSMGGGGSVPPLLAALCHRVPVVLHEANAHPGRANRRCASRAAVVTYAMRGDHPFFRLPNTVEVGMPLRSYQAASGQSAAFPASTSLAAPDSRPAVLVMGGSQGAHVLNERVAETIQRWPELARSLRIVHLTGDRDCRAVAEVYTRAGVDVAVHEFVPDLPRWLDRVDYAITRAGSSTVWELVRAGVPALFVPYPYAVDDHQMANARWAAAIGPYEPLRQGELTIELLGERLAAVAARCLGRGTPGTREIDPQARQQSWSAARQLADILLDVASRGQVEPAASGAVPPASGRARELSGAVAGR